MPAGNLISVIFWELIPGRNLEMSYTFSLVVSGSYLNDNTGVFFSFPYDYYYSGNPQPQTQTATVSSTAASWLILKDLDLLFSDILI